MIYVSQGHEHGIGLEVFLKSFLMLNADSAKLITLVCHLETLEKALLAAGFNYMISESAVQIGEIKLNCKFVSDRNKTQSTSTLLECLNCLSPKVDILLTLPTTKDQLSNQNINYAGYTQFFRNYYDNTNLAMLFSSPKDQFLLITDHIPVKDIADNITSELIYAKTSTVINNYPYYFSDIDEIYFSGLNPHAGENGILGNEEREISSAIDDLESNFKKIKFYKPLSADALHIYKKRDKSQLFVYMFHDQALPYFKASNGIIGMNVTLGLPFLRVSVSHGTAFNLFEKNCANYLGIFYILKKIILIQNKISE